MTNTTPKSCKSDIISRFRPSLESYEDVYKHLHQHPELSTFESRTAKIAADRLVSEGYNVRRHIGGHGVAGVLENGDGPSVLLRAEMDALLIEDTSGLPYASKVKMKDGDGVVKPVSHACGHDMHVTCLMAAAALLSRSRSKWRGRLIIVFQPNEEKGGGARAMIEDGLYGQGDIPKPDFVLGQRVVNIRSGFVATRKGSCLAGKNVFEVVIFGRGGYGATPQFYLDPVVIAAHIIVRLQSIVSREIDTNKMALITCGSVHGGDAANTIPDKAVLKVDIRAYSPEVLQHTVAAFRRVVYAECEASGVSQLATIKMIEDVPPLMSDDDTVGSITEAFQNYFGKDRVERMSLDTQRTIFLFLLQRECPTHIGILVVRTMRHGKELMTEAD